MTDISSVASTAAATVAKQTANLGKAASAATTSFENALSNAKWTVLGRPKTGFASGPTYEANTLAGKTRAAFNRTISAAQSALHIKP
jgi:hypothetical protein